MTDGLTAEQEAERRYQYPGRAETRPKREGFVAGAEWATEREKARAEAADEKIADMTLTKAADEVSIRLLTARAEAAESALLKACDWLDRIIDKYDPHDTEGGRADVAAWRALAAPATEAVTE